MFEHCVYRDAITGSTSFEKPLLWKDTIDTEGETEEKAAVTEEKSIAKGGRKLLATAAGAIRRKASQKNCSTRGLAFFFDKTDVFCFQESLLAEKQKLL